MSVREKKSIETDESDSTTVSRGKAYRIADRGTRRPARRQRAEESTIYW